MTETLKIWAELWPHPWCLYRETLLCANGLDAFPPYLSQGQIAISTGDLPRLQALSLPEGWSLRADCTAIEAAGTVLLTLDLLSEFPETAEVICDGVSWPVPESFREYLEDTYGDYEKGLFDEIGVGLTAPEKEALKAHQEKCREALAFLQSLSQELGLRYYLLAGSVLGAVRHGGFIPWDDDVDIGIRMEDLEWFEAQVKAHLPEGFTLEQPAPNHPYPRMFSKICYEGRCCIDLWPLVPIPFQGLRAKFTWFFGKLIAKMHYCKIGYPVPKHGRLAKVCSSFLSDRAIMNLALWNQHRDTGKAPAYINLYSVYSRQKETIPLIWLDTPATASFEGLEVPVVGCTHEYLTHLYGDYMTRPAPWKRASRHFERFHTAK